MVEMVQDDPLARVVWPFVLQFCRTTDIERQRGQMFSVESLTETLRSLELVTS